MMKKIVMVLIVISLVACQNTESNKTTDHLIDEVNEEAEILSLDDWQLDLINENVPFKDYTNIINHRYFEIQDLELDQLRILTYGDPSYSLDYKISLEIKDARGFHIFLVDCKDNDHIVVDRQLDFIENISSCTEVSSVKNHGKDSDSFALIVLIEEITNEHAKWSSEYVYIPIINLPDLAYETVDVPVLNAETKKYLPIWDYHMASHSIETSDNPFDMISQTDYSVIVEIY